MVSISQMYIFVKNTGADVIDKKRFVSIIKIQYKYYVLEREEKWK